MRACATARWTLLSGPPHTQFSTSFHNRPVPLHSAPRLANSKRPACNMTDKKPVSVLFVCLGNICRSTMAEGVFRSLTQHPPLPSIAKVDSCGTGAYHVGSLPDSRTLSTLNAHGITDYTHRARKFAYPADFHTFDYIFAMDKENLEDLEELRERREKELKRQGKEAEASDMGKVMLFGAFAGEGRRSKQGEVVRDPYYGGSDGFEKAYVQVKRFSENFLKHLDE